MAIRIHDIVKFKNVDYILMKDILDSRNYEMSVEVKCTLTSFREWSWAVDNSLSDDVAPGYYYSEMYSQ